VSWRFYTCITLLKSLNLWRHFIVIHRKQNWYHTIAKILGPPCDHPIYHSRSHWTYTDKNSEKSILKMGHLLQNMDFFSKWAFFSLKSAILLFGSYLKSSLLFRWRSSVKINKLRLKWSPHSTKTNENILIFFLFFSHKKYFLTLFLSANLQHLSVCCTLLN